VGRTCLEKKKKGEKKKKRVGVDRSGREKTVEKGRQSKRGKRTRKPPSLKTDLNGRRGGEDFLTKRKKGGKVLLAWKKSPKEKRVILEWVYVRYRKRSGGKDFPRWRKERGGFLQTRG